MKKNACKLGDICHYVGIIMILKNIFNTISATMTLAFLASASASYAEIVTLNNGDRLTGDIVSQNDSKIVIKTTFGEVALDRAIVAGMSESVNSPTVTVSKAEEAPKEEPKKVVEDPTAPEAVAKTPQWIVDYRSFVTEYIPEGWQFRLRGGMEYRQTSSSVLGVYAAIDAKRKWTLDEFSATAYYNYTTETSVADVTSTTLDKWGLETNFRHNFDETTNWYIQNLAGYKKDLVKGINDQVDEAITFGYRFNFERYDLTIDIAPGPAIRYINADNYDSKWVLMAVLSEKVVWNISDLLRFEHSAYVGLNLSEIEEFSAYLKFALVVEVSEVLDIALRYSYDYDSINSSDAQKDEQTLMLSFEVPFDWK